MKENNRELMEKLRLAIKKYGNQSFHDGMQNGESWSERMDIASKHLWEVVEKLEEGLT